GPRAVRRHPGERLCGGPALVRAPPGQGARLPGTRHRGGVGPGRRSVALRRGAARARRPRPGHRLRRRPRRRGRGDHGPRHRTGAPGDLRQRRPEDHLPRRRRQRDRLRGCTARL
ncbi:MAG: hypothetical protein AVDCRST_MAG06-2489, partial [uncultured Nocardioides sp.]